MANSISAALHPKYRPDIDGLRAIAVLSVVCFHAAPGRLPGGFLGVDVFFVISGYLITTIIVENLTRQSFSFPEFYGRRIKRIFPALITVLCACLIAGTFLLTPEELESLGIHVAGGAGFVANYLLWSEIGYFDHASVMKPLLHLWSLAIEEQFYLIWPLLLLLISKSRVAFSAAIACIWLISFIWNIFTSMPGGDAAFYSPLSRSWELLTGSLLSLLKLRNGSLLLQGNHLLGNLISMCGTIFLVFSFFLVTRNDALPGWWTLLPVFGTACIILVGPNTRFNQIVLSSRLLIWFGLISYPLYLVHWPILSFLRMMEGAEISQMMRAFAVLASIVIASGIYYFIEKPIRSGKANRMVIPTLILTMSGLGGIGYYIYDHQGQLSDLQPKLVNRGDIGPDYFFSHVAESFYPCTPTNIWQDAGKWKGHKRCHQSQNKSPAEIVLLGDSHAEHFFPGLAEAAKDQNIVFYVKGGLPVLENADFKQIFEAIHNNQTVHTIIISAHWVKKTYELRAEDFENQIENTIKQLLDAGLNVVVLDSVPEFSFEPGKCKYDRGFGYQNVCRVAKRSQPLGAFNYRTILETLSAKYSNLEFINTKQYFCDHDFCYMARDGILHFRDSNHLNIPGSKMLARNLAKDYQFLSSEKVRVRTRNSNEDITSKLQ